MGNSPSRTEYQESMNMTGSQKEARNLRQYLRNQKWAERK